MQLKRAQGSRHCEAHLLWRDTPKTHHRMRVHTSKMASKNAPATIGHSFKQPWLTSRGPNRHAFLAALKCSDPSVHVATFGTDCPLETSTEWLLQQNVEGGDRSTSRLMSAVWLQSAMWSMCADHIWADWAAGSHQRAVATTTLVFEGPHLPHFVHAGALLHLVDENDLVLFVPLLYRTSIRIGPRSRRVFSRAAKTAFRARARRLYAIGASRPLRGWRSPGAASGRCCF